VGLDAVAKQLMGDQVRDFVGHGQEATATI